MPARRAIADPRAKCSSAAANSPRKYSDQPRKSSISSRVAELLVRQRGDQRRRLPTARPRFDRFAERVCRHRQRGGRRGHERRVAQRDRARQRLARARPHLHRIAAQRRVRRQFDAQGDGVQRPGSATPRAPPATAHARRRGRRATDPSPRSRRSARSAPENPPASAASSSSSTRRASSKRPAPASAPASGPSSGASERARSGPCTSVRAPSQPVHRGLRRAADDEPGRLGQQARRPRHRPARRTARRDAPARPAPHPPAPTPPPPARAPPAGAPARPSRRPSGARSDGGTGSAARLPSRGRDRPRQARPKRQAQRHGRVRDLRGEVDLERIADDRRAVQERPRLDRQRRRLAEHRLAHRLRHLGVPGVAVTAARPASPPSPAA